jgi:hypothetical protein
MPAAIDSAKRCWWRSLRSFSSSSGFEMNAVSMRIDGMSGAFRTANPACSTVALCSGLCVAMPFSTCCPTLRLSLICAVCERSSSVRASTGSRRSRLTPPMRSAAFSFCASHFAAALVAP